MTTSGTFDFQPSLGETILVAFGRIGIRPSEITQDHMYNARMAANLTLSEWSNSTPMLWEVGLICVPLIQGSATYSVPAETVMVLDLYISYGDPSTDRYLYPVSRTDFASYPNKDQQGFPTVYWFDRLIAPTITFWPVPDGNGPYIGKYYSVRQTQDAVTQNGLTTEVPYRFLDAFTCALAWRLSELYAPQLEQQMMMKMDRSFKIATAQDTENVPMFITPGLSGYYR